jgi:hypothetical protein
MSGKFWITGNKFDSSKVSFSAPSDIGNRYVRYNVRYIYDNNTIKNINLTTNTKDTFVICTGIHLEKGQYAKEHMHQSTIVINDESMDLFGAIVEIAKKFKNEIIPNGELKCPVKEVDDGTVRLYTKLIESNTGKVYTIIQDKDGNEFDVENLGTSFECRPCISINFVVDSNKKASMKIQLTRMYVSNVIEKIDVNLSELD